MSVATFIQPNSAAQSASSYPAVLDAAVSVLSRVGDIFAPHQQNIADMTVAVDPGHLMAGQTLVEQAAQSTGTITAPSANPRIDRIVIDNISGAVSVVTGTEAASPTPPAIPSGKSPIAQILLQTSSTAITNAMITDERDFSNMGTSTGGLINVQTFTSSGTYTPTPGTKKIIVEVQGGGGSAGGCGATSSSQAAASSGGGAGSYAKSMYTSGFSGGIAVTVGQGGAAPAAGANPGNVGSASSFGSLINCPGGYNGNPGVAWPSALVVGGASTANPPTGANIFGCPGSQGGHGIYLNLANVVGGTGGASRFGGGGTAGGGALGGNAPSPGAGGGGSSSINSKPALSGGAGAAGIVIVWEYA